MLRFMLVLCCVVLSGTTAVAATFPIDTRNAYLHLDTQDNAGNALAIDLGSLGLVPGNTIRLESVGDWNAGPYGDVQTGMLGIFSSSPTLLDRSLLNRVPDALDAGVYKNTGPTWPSGEATDTPDDFAFDNLGIEIVIPPGAAYLFVSIADIYYQDNTDPDGDCGVSVTLVPTASVGPRLATRPLRLSAAPNPFARETAFTFRLEQAAPARLDVHDAGGRLVRRLLSGTFDAGDHTTPWDGRDDAGHPVPLGLYFARLYAGPAARTVRLVRVD